jgi:hypothetical protein
VFLTAVTCALERLAGALDPAQDRFATGAPSIGLRLQVSVRQVRLNVPAKIADTGEAAVADHVRGQLAEEPFHQVHPGRPRGDEVQVELRVAFEPVANLVVLVGGVVVDDQVRRQVLRRLAFGLLEEAQPFDVGVGRLQA